MRVFIGLSEVNWVSSATETFNQKNIGMSIEENLRSSKHLLNRQRMMGLKHVSRLQSALVVHMKGMSQKNKCSPS